MLERILDVIVGFILSRDLEKEMGTRQKVFRGKIAEIPSKFFDRILDFIAGTRYSYYLEMRRNMLEGGVVEIPSNIFDWKALERASGYLRLYMDDFHEKFTECYDGNFPVEDFKDWFRYFHIERPEEEESTKKSVSEALLSDDLPRI